MTEHTREPQYQICVELRERYGLTSFGLMSNQVWHDDPKRLLFVLSRYKFVAKMFTGMNSVLEVGCADAFGTRIVCQEVPHVTAVDFDPVFVKDVQERMDPRWPFTCRVHDILESPVEGNFDGAYALDVLEHIPQEQEDRFVAHLAQSLNEHGVLMIGTPSLQSQGYASAPSREGHINCKDYPGLKKLMSQFFQNVFMFSMNDEVIHTGFAPMAHYLLALCCFKK
jgi:2-polyprenyl-3-methyl-5-hydroxy-6-metoxy-1,4-benzoquinol methylase